MPGCDILGSDLGFWKHFARALCQFYTHKRPRKSHCGKQIGLLGRRLQPRGCIWGSSLACVGNINSKPRIYMPGCDIWGSDLGFWKHFARALCQFYTHKRPRKSHCGKQIGLLGRRLQHRCCIWGSSLACVGNITPNHESECQAAIFGGSNV
jgi:cation transport regulator ChaC